MTDRYRIIDVPDTSSTPARAGRLRSALWLLLIVSLAANAATSALGLTAVSIALGLITLACAAGLVVHHYRHRDG